MNMDALIDEICRRVLEKAKTLETPVSTQEHEARKPGLLILTKEHGCDCHRMLEHEKLSEKYQTRCALLAEYQCPPDAYEAVIACTLTNEALGKIAHGIFDSGYTRVFGEALLGGKRILVPEEEVELYRFRDTAPKPFYERLEANLEILKRSGVQIVPFARIPGLLLEETDGEEKELISDRKDAGEAQKRPTAQTEQEINAKEAVLRKKIITERDIAALANEKIQTVIVGEKAILSDLAREFAAGHHMVIRREAVSPGKKEQKL